MKEKIIVGMSGGVDSSVAAYLLKEAGYEVVGVTMRVWQWEDARRDFGADKDGVPEKGTGAPDSAAADAARVCAEIGIPHHVVDFRKEFEKNVVEYFVREYAAGRTPNPCIACNRHVKWESLLHRCEAVGADCVATGHYAGVAKLENGRYALKACAASGKDQTYALYRLTQGQLSRTRMPLGDYSKEEVRKLARRAGLSVADKQDSQEICFVQDNDYARFIEKYSGREFPPGNFVDRKGNVLGRHRGIIHYTVGQRRGLSLSLPEPAYVLAIRPRENEVVLGFGREIFARGAVAGQLNFMGCSHVTNGMQVTAKIRYNHAGAAARLYMRGEGELYCEFEEEQRAVTPGQALVFYDGEYVLGGGTIVRADG